MPPGGPGMFTDQPSDRELYGYGLLEIPTYGGICTGSPTRMEPSPPPTIDFDLVPAPCPLIMPVPVQELPPVWLRTDRRRFRRPRAPRPRRIRFTSGRPDRDAAGRLDGRARRLTHRPLLAEPLRPGRCQVNAQSSTGGTTLATQAGYTCRPLRRVRCLPESRHLQCPNGIVRTSKRSLRSGSFRQAVTEVSFFGAVRKGSRSIGTQHQEITAEFCQVLVR